MVYKSNLASWEGALKEQEVAMRAAQEFEGKLRTEIEAMGTEKWTVEAHIEHSYGSRIRVGVFGLREAGVSTLEAAQIISRAAGLPEPPLKFHYRGSANGSCRLLYDDWSLSAEDDPEGKVCVHLHFESGWEGYTTCRWTITVYHLAVPGYLLGVKETPGAAKIREDVAREEKEATARHERAKRAAATRRRNKQPKIESEVATQKPMLIGPKELSLCDDAPENIETPQLEEVT